MMVLALQLPLHVEHVSAARDCWSDDYHQAVPAPERLSGPPYSWLSGKHKRELSKPYNKSHHAIAETRFHLAHCKRAGVVRETRWVYFQ